MTDYIDEYIEVNARYNRKYYEKLGYKAEGGNFYVKPTDLLPKSSIKVRYRCKKCKKVMTAPFRFTKTGYCRECYKIRKTPLVKKGDRVGRLTALVRHKKDGIWWWQCKCDCGRLHSIRQSDFRNKRIKSCGCIQNLFILEDRDLSIAHSFYNTPKWKLIAEEVKERDKVCVKCGSPQSLNAHHLYDRIKYPEYQYDKNMIVTLCARCHRYYHSIHPLASKSTFKQFMKNKN